MKTRIFIRNFLLFGLMLVVLVACPKYEYFTGSFPETPTNLSGFNTEFDDYNMASPIIGETFPLCFSTNRNSNGANYDIIYKLMTIEFSRTDGTLKVFENKDPEHYSYHENSGIIKALEKINTSFDEFGPYLVPMEWNYNGNNYQPYFFLYSNNASGSQDIMFTQNLENENYVTPLEVEFLNSEFDDAYPTFNNDNSEIYFTSNREGNFSIYKVGTDNNKEILEILTDNSPALVEKDALLSSEFDDKCPFISHDLLVFTSNREGGFGGYDLYYCRLEDDQWSDPINFGNKINTEYDEFRPIVRPQWDFSNDLMLFSSNRPGGKGGFDLYYVGVDKINRLE
ncbi:MAG: hypothetical protein U9N53_10055 [Bacteroidota bacterium]|nr:hypothetical protein [Bacteroidota bacterium]